MTSWKNTNRKYVREGELYLSFDFLKSWEKEVKELNRGKEGARYKYPDSLIQFCSVMKVVFHLPYRQQQGLLRTLKKYVSLPAVPCYTQIDRRINKLGLDVVKSLVNPEDAQIIAIDSSGIKLYNSGEWIREKHKKRKPFLKLHVAVNTQTLQAVAQQITTDNVGDSKLALELVDEARNVKRVSKVLMDGAYDTYKIWNGLNARAVKPLIRLRKNAIVNYKKSKTRSKVVKQYKGNEKEWVKATGFGQRWQAETWYSAFKRRFGEHCYSTKPENIIREILLKVCICNRLIT